MKTGLPYHTFSNVFFVKLTFCLFLGWQILAATKKAAKGGPPPSSAGSGEMGYAGSGGLQNQYFASNNTPCGYICYGFGQFDGQGSGHDFSGNVSSKISDQQLSIKF
jgi:hypothetical protein